MDDLVEELCPDGVTFERLADIGDWYGGGTPSKDRLEYWTDGTIPWLSPKDMGKPSIEATEDYITETAVARSATKLVPRNSVAIVVRSSILDRVLPTALVPIPIALNQDMKAIVAGERVLPGFLAHLIRSHGPALLRAARKTGGSVASIEVSRLMNCRVPVPPLEVQREIVRILDTFTELEAELEAGLEAELEARRRQYESHRREIIEGLNGRLESLADLGQWRGGITPPKDNPRYWESGTIPWLASMDVSGSEGREIRGKVTKAALDETSLRVIPGPTVVVVMRSNILRRALPVGIVESDVTVNQDIRALVPRAHIRVEYVYQALRAASEDIREACVRTDGSMAAVDSKAFLDFRIPMPSLGDQEVAAGKLRHIDAIVNDLSGRLSAELSARRRQYEHYRDRLLTFEEAMS